MVRLLKIFLVIFIVFISYSYFIKLTPQDQFSKIIPQQKTTPFEFQEMTIPYLRNREYKSKLRELTKYSENTNYTSYLTSYDSDGFNVNGFLTVPNNGKNKNPAIVFVHGYIAPTTYSTTERYADHVDYLARSEYVVFKIDLRGHGNSEGEAGGSYYSGDYVIDTLNAYEALKNTDFVDSEKIGLWGHSMAGNVTFRSFMAKEEIPAIAVWAGAGFTYQDLLDYRISDMSYRSPNQSTERAKKRQRLRELYGEFNKDNDFWKQVVATNYLEGKTGALALFHAVDDAVVSVEYSRNLNKILGGSEINHLFYEYPNGGHNITGLEFTKAMSDTVAFYDKYLKNI